MHGWQGLASMTVDDDDPDLDDTSQAPLTACSQTDRGPVLGLQVHAVWRDRCLSVPFGTLVARFLSGKAALAVPRTVVFGGAVILSLTGLGACTVECCTGVVLGPDRCSSSIPSFAAVVLGCLHSSLGFGGIVGMPLPPAAHSCIFSPCNYPACVLLALWTSTSDLLGAPKTHIGGAGVSARQVHTGFYFAAAPTWGSVPLQARPVFVPTGPIPFSWHPAQAFP